MDNRIEETLDSVFSCFIELSENYGFTTTAARPFDGAYAKLDRVVGEVIEELESTIESKNDEIADLEKEVDKLSTELAYDSL